MIQIEHNRQNDIIVLRASGTLTEKDYDAALPEIEHALEIAEGPLRVMIRLEDFHGWTIGALWEELKFDIRHLSDFGRIAVVGDSRLEEWGSRLSAPFFKSEMRYYPFDREAEAMKWLSDTSGAER